MLSTKIPFLNTLSESPEKSFFRSSHSTDTEPEVDVDNNKSQPFILSPNNQAKQNDSNNNSQKSKRKGKSVFDDFIGKIPCYEYDQQIIRKNKMMKKGKQKNKDSTAFHKIEMSNNRFLNYFDAFLNIAHHCQINNQKFSRDNCKEYLKDCYIIDFSHDGYVPITSQIPPKQFNKYFRQAQQEMKFL